MDHMDSELEQAREELSFWREFERWWRAKQGHSEEPRIREAIENSEMRYLKAEIIRKTSSEMPWRG
jgi:hypothetical protein